MGVCIGEVIFTIYNGNIYVKYRAVSFSKIWETIIRQEILSSNDKYHFALAYTPSFVTPPYIVIA